jgi:hypothetical protein
MKKFDQYITEATINKKDKALQSVIKQLYSYYSPGLFSDEEMQAFANYTGNSYDMINRYLYKGFDPGITPENAEYVQSTVDIIDGAFNEIKAPFAYTVYTGLSQRYNPDDLIIGNQYMFRGYVSATLDYKNMMGSFTKSNVILQIGINQGQQSIFVDPLIPNSTETEVLLPRGSRIQLLNGPQVYDEQLVDKSTGYPIVFFTCALIENV